jgi:hypothetical protein
MDPDKSDQANQHVGSGTEFKCILVSGARVLSLLAALWLIFYVCSRKLSGIRPAQLIVYDAKVHDLSRSVQFTENIKNRILIFGDSRILSGFIPELFDDSGSITRSFNFGLPATVHFLSVLEDIVKGGQIPTHVILTVGWSQDNMDGSDNASPDDQKKLIDSLFPFRMLPRDLTLFLIRSRNRGGIIKYYRYGSQCVKNMLAERGYYFIEGQSMYPDHRLPEGFRLKKDRPDKVLLRRFNTGSRIFKRLKELHDQHGINFYIVPCYYRKGAYAEPSIQNSNAEVFKKYKGFQVLGPEYYLFPNKYFSDPAHLNPEGAEVYTKKLRHLLADYL